MEEGRGMKAVKYRVGGSVIVEGGGVGACGDLIWTPGMWDS